MRFISVLSLSTLATLLVSLAPSDTVEAAPQKEDLQPVIEWVETTGKQITVSKEFVSNVLRRDTILPAVQKAFQSSDGTFYVFTLVTVEGRRVVVLQKKDKDFYRAWPLKEDGAVVRSWVKPTVGDHTTRDGLVAEKEFLEVWHFFQIKTEEWAKNRVR